MLRRRSGREGFERLYRGNVDAVYAFFAYSVARDAAEDLTASTFERALKAYGRYDPQLASERTWLLTIARNLLIDHLRRGKHREALALDDEHLELELPAEDDPYLRHLVADQLLGWLSHLGERERTVLALRFGADLEASDVAQLLDLTPANVHQIVSRSLKKLREVAERSGVSDSA